MNKKKWRRKFNGRDSARWLKHHGPMYSAPHLAMSWNQKVMEAILEYPSIRCEVNEERSDIRYYARDRRPVELTLMWCIPWERQRLYNAVQAAIFEMRRRPHGSTATKLIKYRYWSGFLVPPSLEAAALHLGISHGRADQLERTFKGAVSRRLGHRVWKGANGIVR